ncbi:site-specific integrase [Paractinoplanes ferrugineus]
MPPSRLGPWDTAGADDIVSSLTRLVTWRAGAEDDLARQRAARRVLQWLSGFEGRGWQAQWEAAGIHDSSWVARVQEAFPDDRVCRRGVIVPAMGGLLLRRVVLPSYRFLRAYRANTLLRAVTEEIAPQVFTRIRQTSAEAGLGQQHVHDGMNAIAKMVLHTGRDPDELTGEDVLRFRAMDMHLSSGRSFSPTGVHAAWAMLHRAGIISGPQTLLESLRRGQRPTAEIVDRYAIRCRPIRDVIVRYLDERRPSLDYGTFRVLAATLAGRFWAELEKHHPGIDSLHLAPDVVQAWKQRLSQLAPEHGGGQRSDYIENLLQVRAFYLDITQWALEDPSWTPWAVPCPIRRGDTVGIYKKRRAVVARMHQRVRDMLPHLNTILDTAEDYRTEQAVLLAKAAATEVDGFFEHVGVRYQRAIRKSSTGRERTPSILAVDTTSSELINLSRREDEAFWAWAVIQTLRHTGVRVEELLEITQLALVSYRLADTGETVPLLQIVPSKSDEERLLLVSPELAHVLATIISRLRDANDGTVPLTRRYDDYEATTGPTLPHLFQRRNGWRNEVITGGTATNLIKLIVARAQLTDAAGQPLRCTPHDFRRMFATEAVTGGLPVHIAARILGHHNLTTTQAYLAVFQDDLIRSYRAFLDQRRATRPTSEYREPTEDEWREFEQHFALRQLELGTCARPYGTPCKHEHACVRCPMLRVDPRQRSRLIAIVRSLSERIAEARLNGWLGEVQGLQTSLNAAEAKLAALDRAAKRPGPVPLGLPTITGGKP